MTAGRRRIPGARSFQRSVRWLRSRFGSRALVLGYHRVADEAEDPFALCVSPARFAEQLDVLRRRARPMPLGQLLRAFRDGHPPKRAVAVTFDDGYADLLEMATPLLERHEVPATCFVVTGALGQRFWWDMLARFVRDGVRRGRTLRLPLSRGEVRWESSGEAPGEWSAPERRAPSHATLLPRLYRLLRALDDGGRRRALCTLEEWSGSDDRDAPAARALDADELRALVSHSIWSAGTHTHTHPDLATLDASARRSEIEGSKHRLEWLLGRQVEGFAYPFGSASSAVADQVRAAGFRWACISENDVLRGGTDPFHVPRFWPGDRDGDRFERWLRHWL